MELMFQPLKKYAEFTGRARRKEFWLFWLFTLGVSVVGSVFDRILFGASGFQPFAGLFGLALLVPSVAVAFRRLHDTDRSAWWLLLWLLPVLGWIALFVFYVLPGTVGPNRFGPDPKETSGDLARVFS
jgi:uncharacterized membrane protein YhaH (DUF805 family)